MWGAPRSLRPLTRRLSIGHPESLWGHLVAIQDPISLTLTFTLTHVLIDYASPSPRLSFSLECHLLSGKTQPSCPRAPGISTAHPGHPCCNSPCCLKAFQSWGETPCLISNNPKYKAARFLHVYLRPFPVSTQENTGAGKGKLPPPPHSHS